jgi:DDE superfamily endonuclease
MLRAATGLQSTRERGLARNGNSKAKEEREEERKKTNLRRGLYPQPSFQTRQSLQTTQTSKHPNTHHVSQLEQDVHMRCVTVYTDTLLHMADQFADILYFRPNLTYQDLKRFASVIDTDGQKVWGSVDGTFRPIARPIDRQVIYYSGYYHLHGVKYQAIQTPDGLITSLIGPFAGSLHDVNIWDQTAIQDKIRSLQVDQEALYIFGDSAYQGRLGIICPKKDNRHNPLTQIQKSYQQWLSSHRVNVECGFALVSNTFNETNLKPKQRIGLRAIGAEFRLQVLLTNIRSCMRGFNSISVQYGLEMPTPEQYLCI